MVQCVVQFVISANSCGLLRRLLIRVSRVRTPDHPPPQNAEISKVSAFFRSFYFFSYWHVLPSFDLIDVVRSVVHLCAICYNVYIQTNIVEGIEVSLCSSLFSFLTKNAEEPGDCPALLRLYYVKENRYCLPTAYKKRASFPLCSSASTLALM